MTETPFFFANGSAELFGVWHQPDVDSGRTAFVFCHPFGEEKLWAHRVFVTFARSLAADGHPVLRFDYMGNGDSSGRFGESSLTSAVADVHAAIAEVRRRLGPRRVSLLGLRLGATIASLAAESVVDLERLVLWAPIVDGARYMQELLRINLSTQLAVYKEVRRDREQLVEAMRAGELVNIDGYDTAFPMYDQVSAVKLAAVPKTCASPCLVVQVDRQTGRAMPELEQLVQTYPAGQLALVQEEPFWKEIQRFYDRAPALFEETRRWLSERPDAAGVTA